VRRSLIALLKKVPSAYGWCRTRWSCATLAAQLTLQRGIAVSASTMRRWLHALGWVWKRAQLVARDDDPQRIEKLARSRHTLETLGKRAVVLFADELDIHLLPKVGYQWMPTGETVTLVTPGQNQKHYLAGARELKTGRVVHCRGIRKTTVLFRALLDHLEWRYPKAKFDHVYVVGDNYGIHKAKVVERWLVAHPRFEMLYLPVLWRSTGEGRTDSHVPPGVGVTLFPKGRKTRECRGSGNSMRVSRLALRSEQQGGMRSHAPRKEEVHGLQKAAGSRRRHDGVLRPAAPP
jgi:hypothetical protein